MTKRQFSTEIIDNTPLQKGEVPKRIIMVGGFLGAGKTTLIRKLAAWLTAKNMRVGVVTNDQGQGLVDTATMRHGAAEVGEVTGGCFCCQAEALGQELVKMDAAARPHVFIAEPVGSCTDLVATVLLPMQQIYPQPLNVAPMSVLVDVARLESFMLSERDSGGAEQGKGFAPEVCYIFDKQLEEAEIIVLNKVDLLSKKRLIQVEAWLQAKHPDKRILQISTKTGNGLDAWFALVTETVSMARRIMEVDYAKYGAGEERMAWYNATLALHSKNVSYDPNVALKNLARIIQKDLVTKGAEIAHFKMSLTNSVSDLREMAVVNCVRNAVPPTLSVRSTVNFLVGELLVNLRAEAEPELLSRVVARHLNAPQFNWYVIWKQRASFKPGQPKPTFRVTNVLSKSELL